MRRLFHVKYLMFIAFLFWLALFAQGTACAQPAFSSTDLIQHAKEDDGMLVVYAGEVVGDVMSRGEYAWINVHDGDNAIGIWLKTELAKEILFTGSFKTRGDRIEVNGIFNHACKEHGGDLDIHAQSLRKISNGRLVPEKINLEKKNLALLLLGAVLLIWILTLLKHK